MKLVLAPCLAVALSVACGAVHAELALTEARSTLEKWVETRQLISKTRGDWRSDKEMLEQTVALLERELKSVEEQIGKVSTNNAAAERERTQADASLKLSQAAMDRAKGFVTEFEPKLTAALPALPAPLQDILKPLISRIPRDASSTKMATTERVQVLVGILNELDKFNSAVNIFSEKRRNPRNEEVAVETVYIGLGAAFFVNESGDFAGVGSPKAGSWEWASKPELAASVREVIKIYRNEASARFVPLPVVIK